MKFQFSNPLPVTLFLIAQSLVFSQTYANSIDPPDKLDLDKTLYLVTFNYRPYAACEHKTLKGGFIKDMLEATCEEAGIQCLAECFPNRRAKAMLKSGAAHGNYPLGWNADREKWLYRSPGINFAEHVFYKLKDDAIDNIEAFAGKTVGVFGPSNLSWTLEKIRKQLVAKTGKSFEISVLPESNGNNFKKLSAGRIDGLFINGDMGRWQMQSLGIDNVDRAFGYKTYNQYIGFSKEQNTGKRKQLIDRFNAAFESLRDQGKIQKIAQKHNMQQADSRLD